MNDLISRQAAIAVADYSDYAGLSVDDVKKVTDEVVKGLRRLPSAQPADVVEVVWCKECKYRKFIDWGIGDCVHPKGSKHIAYDYHYCSYGERRNNE